MIDLILNKNPAISCGACVVLNAIDFYFMQNTPRVPDSPSDWPNLLNEYFLLPGASVLFFVQYKDVINYLMHTPFCKKNFEVILSPALFGTFTAPKK